MQAVARLFVWTIATWEPASFSWAIGSTSFRTAGPHDVQPELEETGYQAASVCYLGATQILRLLPTQNGSPAPYPRLSYPAHHKSGVRRRPNCVPTTHTVRSGKVSCVLMQPFHPKP